MIIGADLEEEIQHKLAMEGAVACEHKVSYLYRLLEGDLIQNPGRSFQETNLC